MFTHYPNLCDRVFKSTVSIDLSCKLAKLTLACVDAYLQNVFPTLSVRPDIKLKPPRNKNINV